MYDWNMLRRMPATAIVFSLVGLLWIVSHVSQPARAQEGEPRVAEGFVIERVYQVPREQGSWVSLTADPRGRLIASDQYGNLYRITNQGTGVPPKVETIPVELGFAHGLLYAFDSLYVVAHAHEGRPSGLFRVQDTDGDDRFDSVSLLRTFEGSGEHGPHAVILSHDGQSLLVCGGNHTNLPNPEQSRVPRIWDEDQLLTRMPDPGGHAVGRMAPGGWICRTDPQGETFELLSVGYRNQYDIALDPNGELFTYDADMEWDIGSPWYRPTRVCHAVDGSEYGWRHGSYKWPEYYGDSLPSAVDIGPGSPTGVVFGSGALFPAKYQRALFICDWSYGIIYAVHLTPAGASYQGEAELFCSAPCLQAADITIGKDGALYFVTGGRHTQSSLYRIRYVGNESTAPTAYPVLTAAAKQRRALEQRMVSDPQHSAAAIDEAWPQMASDDRWIRFAARTVLEHQPAGLWAERLVDAQDPYTVTGAVMALARLEAKDYLQPALAALTKLDWEQLDRQQRLDLIRTYALLRLRFADEIKIDEAVGRQLDDRFPADDNVVDRELARILAAANASELAPRVMQLLMAAKTQEDQIHYAAVLREVAEGWTPDLRKQYFAWFLDAAKLYGGNSFNGYIQAIRQQAIANLNPTDRQELESVLSQQPEVVDPYAELKSRPLVKQWRLEDLNENLDTALENRDVENGRKLFALAQCYKCHRFEGEGGFVGPDLTGIGRRYSREDLLSSLVDPNRAVSDQYRSTRFTLTDGRTVTGRVVNLNGDNFMVQTDMMNPAKLASVNINDIDDQRPSEVSMMPEGLLDTMTQEEIYDLMAYLRTSQGLPTSAGASKR